MSDRARSLGPAVLAVTAALLLGCGRDPARAPEVVRSVDPQVRATSTSLSDPPVITTPVTDDPADGRREVTDALLRYDLALTALSADPLGAATPGSPVRLAWEHAVDPAAALSTELVERVVDRARIDRVIVRAGPDGSSYHHSVERVTDARDDSISFTWCGYSPGIGHDADSGEIVDDAVGHATGTGRIESTGETWTVVALDELELEILPAGSTDPC